MKTKKKPKKSFLSKVGSIVLGEAIVTTNPFVEVADFVTGGSISDAIISSTEKAASKLNEIKKKSDSKNKVQKVESQNTVQKDEPINKVKENESKSEYNIKAQKSMYNEKLERLIEMALMDGVLTEKEKQVLFKKAEELGIDLDEFEMVLDAKLFKKQKQGAPTKKKDNVIKCPSCNDIIPALSRICPSCEYVINSRKQSSSSEKGLEDLINDIEENLVEIKTQPKSNVFTSMLKHAYITLSLLTIIIITVGVKLRAENSGIFSLVATTLVILSIVTIRKKMKSKSEKNENSYDFAKQKALFEKHSRTANTLFGENKKVKLLLNDLKVELNDIEQERNKNKKTEIIAYIVLAILTISVFLIPLQKTNYEIEREKENAASEAAYAIENENKKADRELIFKAEELINSNKLEDAKLILKDLKAYESIVIVKSKIQLSKLSAKLDVLEPLLDKKRYSKVKLELDKLVWGKISTEYSAVGTEQDIYRTFLKRKEAINNQLPEKYKVEIGSRYL